MRGVGGLQSTPQLGPRCDSKAEGGPPQGVGVLGKETHGVGSTSGSGSENSNKGRPSNAAWP